MDTAHEFTTLCSRIFPRTFSEFSQAVEVEAGAKVNRVRHTGMSAMLTKIGRVLHTRLSRCARGWFLACQCHTNFRCSTVLSQFDCLLRVLAARTNRGNNGEWNILAAPSVPSRMLLAIAIIVLRSRIFNWFVPSMLAQAVLFQEVQHIFYWPINLASLSQKQRV